MDVRQIMESLHPLERKVLPHLSSCKTAQEIVEKTGMLDIEVIRALQWLSNKKVLELQTLEEESVVLDTFGVQALDAGLPERRFLSALAKAPLTLLDVKKKAALSDEEVNVCIGTLRGKAAIAFGADKKILLTEQGKNFLEKESLEEQFLKKLVKGSVPVAKLVDEQRFAFDQLKKRKQLIKVSVAKTIIFTLTTSGRNMIKQDIKATDFIEILSPEFLKSGEWKNKTFRRYDITSNVPQVHGGKHHFINQAIEYARQVWLDMGFQEMDGPILNTSFWNFDALFVAQDHPVRDMQDTFFIKDPSSGKLPDKKLVAAIKGSHEGGFTTGSKGWGGMWSEEDAKRNVLRTHTTVLSVKTIASLKKTDLPAKFFAFGKCFRNETVDWSHLFEFNQTEGIVIDPNANFRHLLGYLKQFFAKMGFSQARFRPAYFPYTEPSVEIDVFHPVHKKWVELGGAGIFRPEVVVPLLGIDVPVLAWGPGFDRIITEYYKITDLRELYKNDIKQLRDTRAWLK
ncbi:phenylalanine--tRNA ligase subunit alpha [Candidatus Woesearchaeota archaeon]|nr:phenylalanine--tRNA ligase subunit alpha [Candidatus Woesearchaeota archaeon]